ncbi:DRTGG domain-containing protein [Aureibacillus halotolerans]|uniref:Putative transcriptional regulator n=1 Tax=Aureibacillus halotolerans TaxID=1508390 RepID=A0A4R6TYU2_9BACI|nr:DRTGG domain-containing protein [Aureibacillus halotolerans]TDQ39128.1 putative transcriptional regulator [Aureibacillus halotolerans]
MATKHEQILQFIYSLDVGQRISVRGIAKAMNVSDGTAYRAIKEAENKGFVSTIERVGTIRIEKKDRNNFQELTYAEVVNVIDGQVLGGKEGLHKTLNKFVIGAMKLDAMMTYTEAGNLLIVGNRIEAHKLALEAGAAVLITGGFNTDDDVKALADEHKLPIISSKHDTFTVADMINRAIYDQMIKKEIVFVEDIQTSFEHTHYLYTTDPVQRWLDKNEETNHSRYPVVDEHRKVVGMVTSRDILHHEAGELIEKVMSKQLFTITKKTTVASAAQMMIWNGIEMVPVVDEMQRLVGIISRQDVLKALQRHPQSSGETLDNAILASLKTVHNQRNERTYTCELTPQMTNALGTMSYGVFTTLLVEAATRLLNIHRKSELVVENMNVLFIHLVQLGATLQFTPRILEIGRRTAKIEVEVTAEGKLVSKVLLVVQLLQHTP